MNQLLFIFNPEHDLALANNDENYIPPKSAREFAASSDMLPALYAPDGALILRSDNQIVDLSGNPVDADISQLIPVPWGWDKAAVKRLRLLGFSQQQLPSDSQLDTIRRLSHRSTSIEAMALLKERLTFVKTDLPTVIHTLNELQDFLLRHGGRAVFKAPWSGSGKGIIFARGGLTDKQINRCGRIIAAQGGIIAERLYEVVQDFAMEFSCYKGDVQFLGYSLFKTHNGAYLSNEAIDDKEIVQRIVSFVNPEWINAVRELISCYLRDHAATVYEGPVGVDMLVYKDDAQYLINPVVEINFRFTMGMVHLDLKKNKKTALSVQKNVSLHR